MADTAVIDEYRDSVCVLPGQEKRVSHTHFPAVTGDHVLDDGLLIVLVTQVGWAVTRSSEQPDLLSKQGQKWLPVPTVLGRRCRTHPLWG